jgi:adenylosuccinate lyase
MLNNISPIDGRYAGQTSELQTYFSEAALMRYRVQIEIEYFIALLETGIISGKELSHDQKSQLRSIYKNFSEEDAASVKSIESTINHDVKAIEYFIKEKLGQVNHTDLKEWVHFGLTSQDINNSAFPLMIRTAYREKVIPYFKTVRQAIFDFAQQTLAIPMMAYTHGQPASPTILGKEMMVFVDRLDMQIDQMEKTELRVKFGGATGNFNAHVVAFPNIDWMKWADDFTHTYLNIERYKYTTQIEHYDQIAALCHVTMRTNTILIDFCRDIWAYISMNYISQKVNPNEVGSSAMPHKVNPIDFENAEGNLGYANAIYGHLADKLPVSRLQRDLTDSTVSRNIGVPVAHTYLALKSIEKGLKKITPNESRMAADLDDNWTVLAEAIQTVLRREGVSNPYELLKELTRGKEKLTKESLHEFIQTLNVNDIVKEELRKLTPSGYTGVSLQ